MSTAGLVAPTNSRKPFTGSCQCGFVKYVVFLRLPATPEDVQSVPKPWQRIYRCNCDPCRKLGIFHIRLPDAPVDFALISPLDPFTELSDYTCNSHSLHFFFCPKCGGRPFIFMGRGEVTEKDLSALGVSDEQLQKLEITDGGHAQKVWTSMSTDWEESGWANWKAGKNNGGYLSVNAYTLDIQDGLDLREWKEKGWVSYVDSVDDIGEDDYERPHRGGAY